METYFLTPRNEINNDYLISNKYSAKIKIIKGWFKINIEPHKHNTLFKYYTIMYILKININYIAYKTKKQKLKKKIQF